MDAGSEPSFVTGARDVPLLEIPIGRALSDAARRWPDRDAVVAPSGVAPRGAAPGDGGGAAVRWSWAELDRRAEAFAAGLLALGLEPGDRIGIWSLNTTEWVLVQFASAKAGLILVTVNPAYRSFELAYALRQVGCAALVLGPPFKTSDYLAMLREVVPEFDGAAPGRLAAAALPALRVVVAFGVEAPGTVAFEGVAGRAGERERARVAALAGAIRAGDDANIQFTSGTTGTPKGVTLSHRSILNNGYFVGAAMRLAPEDRICVPVPLYHCFGMVMGVLAAVAHGAALVFPGRGFDPSRTLEAAASERCTALYGVPTMFLAMLDHPEFGRFDLSALRTGIMAGSPCPIAVMRRVVEHMHMGGLTICYGMTETSPVSFQSALDDPLERRVSTVGRVHPHVDCRVVDPEGNTVPRGTAGELLTRGYSVMRGYWGEPERTAAVLDPEGWMHTGDLATIDAEGFCNIVGRAKDLIIRGGENVSPREVEDYLYRHPDVQDVAVFGVADPLYGEEVCAWVRARPGAALTAEAVRDFCIGRIAHQKVPRYVEIVDAFPMTVTGKIQKFLMREETERRLGLRAEVTA